MEQKESNILFDLKVFFEIEIFKIQDINKTYERMLKSDVYYFL